MDPRTQLKNKSRKTAREIVDRLDGRRVCHNCGTEGYVEVHHADGDWLNNHPMNLIPLCYWCHKRAHKIMRETTVRAEMQNELEQIVSD